MHPSRTHLDAARTSGGDVPNASSSANPLSSSLPSHSQPSLPSIRQLHPYLPPAGMPTPMIMAEGHGGATSMHYNAHNAYYPYSPEGHPHPVPLHYVAAGPPPQREGNLSYAMQDSEVDELEQQCPPKKKRRRQALSCTECKRRKIKCDRSQPCAPCTRRGEQAKCHWHVVEPVEKYVTRQEFDELKSRLDDLESFVHRFVPLESPSRPIGRYHPTLPGMTPDAVQPFHPGHIGHHSIPPQPPTHAYHGGSLSASPQAQRLPPTQSHDSPHLRSPVGPHLPNPVSPQVNLRSRSPLTSALKHRDAPTATAGGSSSMSTINITRSTRPLSGSCSPPKGTSLPLSLASITSPYMQPKNCLAQTLTPGERLRTVSAHLKGLAVIHAFLHLLDHCHIMVALLTAAIPQTAAILACPMSPHTPL